MDDQRAVPFSVGGGDKLEHAQSGDTVKLRYGGHSPGLRCEALR